MMPSVTTLDGAKIKTVHTWKYLGSLIDDSITFRPHLENLVKKLKLKLCFRRKWLVVATSYLYCIMEIDYTYECFCSKPSTISYCVS